MESVHLGREEKSVRHNPVRGSTPRDHRVVQQEDKEVEQCKRHVALCLVLEEPPVEHNDEGSSQHCSTLEPIRYADRNVRIVVDPSELTTAPEGL